MTIDSGVLFCCCCSFYNSGVISPLLTTGRVSIFQSLSEVSLKADDANRFDFKVEVDPKFEGGNWMSTWRF